MLYFLATEAGTATKAVITKAGVAYAFDGQVTSVRVLQGPNGKAGLVFWSAKFSYSGYSPEHQRWRSIPGSEAMVGLDDRFEVLPELLKRENVLEGALVQLADDHAWEIPIARKRFVEDGKLVYVHNLPRSIGVDDEGEWVVGEPLLKYRYLWNVAEDYCVSCYGGEPREGARDMNIWKELLNAAVEVLNTNYRLAAAEVSLLGLFSKQHAVKVLDVLIDAATLDSWLKKKAEGQPDGVST